MKKLLVSFAIAAFAVTAFTQDKPAEAPAPKGCKECCKVEKGTCKGGKKCEKKDGCRKADCPKAKKA